MDPVVVQVLLGLASLVGGYFLRHLTGSPTSPVKAPSGPVVPSQPSGHPVLDLLSSAALAALQAALEKQQTAAGHSELLDALGHLVPQAPAQPQK